MADLWIAVNRAGTRGTVIDESDLDLLPEGAYLYVQTSAAPHIACHEGRALKQYVMIQWPGTTPTRREYLHRYLLGLEKGNRLQVDHIDRDSFNNRRSNLRAVTAAQNAQNQGARPRYRRAAAKHSRHRGVSWNAKSGRWRAIVGLNGKNNYLGEYEDEDAAAAVAAQFRRENMPFALA